MIGTLAHAVARPARGAEDFSGSCEDLARNEEGDESLGESKEIRGPVNEKVLVATVGIARGVGVVLEQIDVAGDALLAESLLGIHTQPFQDPLPRTIVSDQLLHAVAFGGRILRVAAYIEVQPGPVAQEDIATSAPGNNTSKQIARYFVGTEPALSPERAGDAVFGFDSEDAAIHVSTVGVSGSLRRALGAPQPVG